MKTYFRLLSFAKPIEKFAIPYILATIITVVFGTLNLALLAPLLTVLNDKVHTPVPEPEHWTQITKMMNYYVYRASLSEDKFAALKFVCGIIVASVLLSNASRYFAQRIIESLRIHILLKLRRVVFNNVMDMHMGFFNNERKGDIMTKIASDVQVVQYSVTGTLQVVFKEPLQLIAYMVMLLIISVKLTLFSLLVVPIGGFIISRIVKKLKSQAVASQETYGNMITYLDEALSGMKIVKAFNATGFIKKRFDEQNTKYSKITRSMANRQQSASPVSEFLGVAMVAGIVLYGGSEVLNGSSTLTSEEFIAYIALFSQIMRPAKAMSDSFSNIHSGIVAGGRVLELIDEKPAIVDAPDAIAITDFKEGIELKNVEFGYPNRPVLKGINLTIPKGKTVALVGPSGGGKSTLMDLIPRFIEPQSGEVLIDGQNLNKLQTESVRSLLGTVNQESILFNDTIFNNIAFGKPDATMEQVETAAKIANAHNFIIETENSYQTNTGDRGVKLSGGQRQRLCIARAILNNPPIMLLDEATSALDTESEKLVQDALNNLMKNRTSLIIAHRLSTIQSADIIVVLEDGNIVEQGTHLELMANNGLYRKLIEMQTFQS
ncbi:ABC transporter ATP-binding protein [Mucilaginibacter myungsuensis]|uniref:ABC transporter ATP-binding protein n=1 Tax=Mucilaginibacter myungsuensis TaxID=649104 RepID=A0A929PWQ7_9SPHI|nr:ABC transporter ATP-binding protein [Mucilaginibacter myungsuensis]MBE9662346.1 ABC transporter ATP-binding protein [Mucilaginibacter myungsuensis]MDN3599217.1 ABC transporter ATP-binding protein [Mucilaginibacter myungsuensis]